MLVKRWRVALIACLGFARCATTTETVPLLESNGIPVTLTPHDLVALEVVTRGTAVPDPLPVRGAHVAYSDVEAALGHAVSSGAVPWAEKHREQRPEGFRLLVEPIRAEASYDGQRLIFDLGVRATLRARKGNEYLAQTQAWCRQSALMKAAEGGPVIYACMTHLGRELAGWLGAVEP